MTAGGFSDQTDLFTSASSHCYLDSTFTKTNNKNSLYLYEGKKIIINAAKQYGKKIHIFPQKNEPQELLHGSIK